jgi:hypothetical protein
VSKRSSISNSSNKISLLQKHDVAATLELLKRCSPYYQSGELTAECLNNPRPCIRVPKECITHNAVFTILHYLTDHQFMSPANVRTIWWTFYPRARRALKVYFVLVVVFVFRIELSQIKVF